MPCSNGNSRCAKLIQIGEKVKLNGSFGVFTIMDFEYLSPVTVKLVLKDEYGNSIFLTRRKFEVNCLPCPNHIM